MCRPTWSRHFRDSRRRIFRTDTRCEGPDDMPAHVKAALIGQQRDDSRSPRDHCAWARGRESILCEHRRHGGRRRLVLTLWGEAKTAMSS